MCNVRAFKIKTRCSGKAQQLTEIVGLDIDGRRICNARTIAAAAQVLYDISSALVNSDNNLNVLPLNKSKALSVMCHSEVTKFIIVHETDV